MSNVQVSDKILFNYKSKEYGFLSNFYISEMTLDGKLYYHMEGYFQSIKYSKVDKKVAEHIRNVFPPHVAKNRGETKDFLLTSEDKAQWEDITKIITMKRGLIAKFISSSDLAQKLLATRNAKLIHNTPDDEYWGTGKSNTGKHMWGHMLMEVRSILVDLPDIDDYE